MKNCPSCHVSVTGDPSSCPLCQGDLQGDAEDNAPFPSVPLLMQKNKHFLRSVAFLTVAAAIICVLINLANTEAGWWSLFVVGGIATFWLAFLFIVQKRGNLHKTITWLVAILCGVSAIWDISTGYHRWSVNFVIPITCTSAMIAMNVISRVLKLDVRDYLIYLCIDAIFCITSLFLLIFGELTVVIPSLICAACSLLFLAALFIFEGKTLLEELQRRMHI